MRNWVTSAAALVCFVSAVSGCGGDASGGGGSSGASGSSSAGNAGVGGTATGVGGSSVGTGGGLSVGGASGAGGTADTGGESGAGGSVDTSAEDAAIEAVFSGFAGEYCPALEPCCASDAHAYELSGCESYIQGEIDRLQEQAKAQVAAGHHLSEENLKQCVDDRLAAAKACEPATPESCKHIWYGDSALGAECEEDSECNLVDGVTVRCDYDHDTQRCVGYTNVHAGEPCTWTSELPWPEKGNAFSGIASKDSIERYCAVSEGNTCRGGLCTPIADQLGDTCQMFSCVSGLYCDKTARCAERPTENEACPGFLEDGCADGLFCNSQLAGTGTCEAKRPDGATCHYARECESGLCHMQQCGLKPPSTSTFQCGG